MIREYRGEIIRTLRRRVVTVMASAGALACILHALRSTVFRSLLRALMPN